MPWSWAPASGTAVVDAQHLFEEPAHSDPGRPVLTCATESAASRRRQASVEGSWNDLGLSDSPVTRTAAEA